MRACTLQAQAVPAARPEVVLAPREPPARVTSSVFAVARSACASWYRSSHLCVCCWLSLCVPVGATPSSSCASLFVSLSLRRSRLGSRAVGNRQRMTIDEIGSIALLFRLVLSLTAFSSRHPAERRPAIVLVPFGTPPDHGALVFLFVKERAADCARCARN